ncbi:MAG: hypothetical protein ACTJGT_00795 [Microbacteriaceae bacterium]
MNMQSHAQAPATVRRVFLHNDRQWWWVLGGVNAAALVLTICFLLRPLGYSIVPGIMMSFVLFTVVNAIFVPLTIVRLRAALVIDYAHGTLTASGVTHSAGNLQSLIETTRTFPGTARMLTLVFASGVVEVQVDGFGHTPRTNARDEALLEYVWRCLPVPDQHRSVLMSGSMLSKSLIGKQEATALLRSYAHAAR